VGYGDVYPVTPLGQVVGSFLAGALTPSREGSSS